METIGRRSLLRVPDGDESGHGELVRNMEMGLDQASSNSVTRKADRSQDPCAQQDLLRRLQTVGEGRVLCDLGDDE